jgi:DNA-binding NtrC family response regulator
MKPVTLIADHDADLAEIFQRFLHRHGYDAETAAGQIQCLERLQSAPCQVLLLDPELPCGGVDRLINIMRDEPRLCAVPVVLTSEYRDHQAPNHLLPPVVKVLERPFSLSRLLESVRVATAQGYPSVN